PTSTTRPWAAASAMIRSVSFTMVVSSCPAGGTASEAMNISGDATASVRASRSSSPGARSSCSATMAGASPARRATSSTNSLSMTVHASAAATWRATAAPPDAYCRVIVMTGCAISGFQVLAQLADVEQRQAALGGHEDDQVVGALQVVQHFDPLLGERLGRQRLVQQALLLGLQPGDLHPVPLGSPELVLVADLGEDLGRLHGIDLPADRDFHVHAHLLARERLDRLDLLAAGGPLLLARGVALDLRPGRDQPDPCEQR